MRFSSAETPVSSVDDVRQDLLPLVFGIGCALAMLGLGGLWWSMGLSPARAAPVDTAPAAFKDDRKPETPEFAVENPTPRASASKSGRNAPSVKKRRKPAGYPRCIGFERGHTIQGDVMVEENVANQDNMARQEGNPAQGKKSGGESGEDDLKWLLDWRYLG
jgi:hypothetical protein